MSQMLSEAMWQSVVLLCTGLLTGLVLGLLMYAALFSRPNGCHRKGAVTASRGYAPAQAPPGAHGTRRPGRSPALGNPRASGGPMSGGGR